MATPETNGAPPAPGFKWSYEPNLAAGGAMGAIMAILVYYKVLDVEAAGLWAVVVAALAPVLQGWIARFFTTPTAKLADAGIHPDTIDARANATRTARQASKRGGGA